MPRRIDEGGLALGIGTPEHEDDGFAFIVDLADDGVGEAFPPLALMSSRLPFLDGQHAVQQEHALLCPMFEKTVTCRRYAEIRLHFLVDIDQEGGMRTPGRTLKHSPWACPSP